MSSPSTRREQFDEEVSDELLPWEARQIQPERVHVSDLSVSKSITRMPS